MELRFVCSLFLIKFLAESRSCSIEEIVRETVENEMKSVVLLKRQLPDTVDEDSSEIFGGINDRDVSYMTAADDSVKTSPAVTETDVIDPADTNCSCKMKTQANKQSTPKMVKKLLTPTERNENNSNKEINAFHPKSDGNNPQKEKSNLNKTSQFNEKSGYTSTAKNQYDGKINNKKKSYTSPVNMGTIKTSSQPFRPTPTTPFTETQKPLIVVKEIEYEIDSAIKELCPHYKDVPDLDVPSMADVWQLVYYKADQELSCFKIFLKKTSPQSRKRYEEKYSTFNDSITWQECFLELSSTGRLRDDRKHFLQGTKSDKGILDNIIISEYVENDNKIISMQEQTPDQWLVTDNLLLMRDCGTGDVVVFSRLSSKPEKGEVEEALFMFGENGMNGTMTCDNSVKDDKNREEGVLKNKKYHILS